MMFLKNNAKKIALLFLLPAIIEVVFFNLDYFRLPKNERGVFKISSSSVSEVKVEGDKDNDNYSKTELTIDLGSKYIKKLYFDYDISATSVVTMVIEEADYYGNITETSKKYVFSEAMGVSIKNINNTVRSVKLISENVDFSIENIQIVNGFIFNEYRYLFMFVVLLLLLVLITYRDYLFNNLSKLFAIISIFIGLLMIFLTPRVAYISWDDETHFKEIYNMLDFDKEITSLSLEEATNDHKKPYSYEEQKIFDSFLNSNNSNVLKEESKDGYYITYDKYTYFPSALFVKISKLLNLKFATTFIFGEVANLLLYVSFIYFALSKAKYGKKLIFVISLLPTNLFLATQYSRDAIITAGIILGLTFFFNEFFDKKSKLSVWNYLIFIISVLIASLSKAIYIPFILLIILLPNTKFKNNKHAYIVKSLTIVIFLLMIATFVLPTAISPSAIGGDARGGNTSVFGQLHLILQQPLSFSRVFLNFFFAHSITDFFVPLNISSFCYLGDIDGALYYLILFLLFFVSITDGKKDMPILLRISLIAIVIMIIMMIMGSMYLIFTPVAYSTINGVQPRYFMPLLFPLLFSTLSFDYDFKISEKKYNLFITIIILFVLVVSIFNFMLYPICW